jgi:hypothetical protein
MAKNDEENYTKLHKKFHCKICDYSTSHKGTYDKHLLSGRHLLKVNNEESTNQITQNSQPVQEEKKYTCACGKSYKHASSLWNHKKRCNKVEETTVMVADDKEKDAMLLDVVRQNKELHKVIIDQNKQISELIPKVGNNNTTNNFNLNVFLNEECKDAIDWHSFINSIEFELSSLKELTDTNITKSITNAVCNKIHELGIYKRPIHCVDQKRKKLCIKNMEEWEKDENKVNELINNGDKKLQHKYIKLINEWETEHPNWHDDEDLVEEYMVMSSKIYENVDSMKYKVELTKETTIPK